MELETFNYDMIFKEIDYCPSVVLGGERGSGKNILLNDVVFHLDKKLKFKNIFAFSSTDKYKGSLGFMKQENIFQDLEPNLEKIYNKRFDNDDIPYEKLEPILILFNDIDGLRVGKKEFRNNSIVRKIFTQGRHKKICCVVLCQRIKSQLNPTIRLNSSITFFFAPFSINEQRAIKDDYFGLVKNRGETEAVYHNLFSSAFTCGVVLSFKSGITSIKDYIKKYSAPFPMKKFKSHSLRKVKNKKKSSNNSIYETYTKTNQNVKWKF